MVNISLDGDTVIIERDDSADNGSVVVALIDEEEVTLKRLRRKGGAIALEDFDRFGSSISLDGDRLVVGSREPCRTRLRLGRRVRQLRQR